MKSVAKHLYRAIKPVHGETKSPCLHFWRKISIVFLLIDLPKINSLHFQQWNIPDYFHSIKDVLFTGYINSVNKYMTWRHNSCYFHTLPHSWNKFRIGISFIYLHQLYLGRKVISKMQFCTSLYTLTKKIPKKFRKSNFYKINRT